MAVTINGSGQVPVQVVSTTKTDTFTTSSTSYVDITGLSVSITPTNSSNKVMVFVTSNASTPSSGENIMMQLVRGSTAIDIGDASSSRSQASAQGRIPNDGNAAYAMCFNFLDSPSTTSATTYKVQIKVQSGGSAAINRTNSDSDTSAIARTASTITVMEVSG